MLSEAFYSESLVAELARLNGRSAVGCGVPAGADIPGVPVRVDYSLVARDSVGKQIELGFFVGG